MQLHHQLQDSISFNNSVPYFGFSGLPPGINGNYVPDVSGTFGLLTISGSPDLSDPIISALQV